MAQYQSFARCRDVLRWQDLVSGQFFILNRSTLYLLGWTRLEQLIQNSTFFFFKYTEHTYGLMKKARKPVLLLHSILIMWWHLPKKQSVMKVYFQPSMVSVKCGYPSSYCLVSVHAQYFLLSYLFQPMIFLVHLNQLSGKYYGFCSMYWLTFITAIFGRWCCWTFMRISTVCLHISLYLTLVSA